MTQELDKTLQALAKTQTDLKSLDDQLKALLAAQGSVAKIHQRELDNFLAAKTALKSRPNDPEVQAQFQRAQAALAKVKAGKPSEPFDQYIYLQEASQMKRFELDVLEAERDISNEILRIARGGRDPASTGIISLS
jgi:hypothetical protein